MRNQYVISKTMQNYTNYSKDLVKNNEVSGYTLLKLGLNQVKTMSKCGLSVDDVRHIPMYEEYLSLRKEGVPKERIYQHFRKEYSISESTVKRVVKRFSQRVTP